jgi:hypothetical protein
VVAVTTPSSVIKFNQTFPALLQGTPFAYYG